MGLVLPRFWAVLRGWRRAACPAGAGLVFSGASSRQQRELADIRTCQFAAGRQDVDAVSGGSPVAERFGGAAGWAWRGKTKPVSRRRTRQQVVTR